MFRLAENCKFHKISMHSIYSTHLRTSPLQAALHERLRYAQDIFVFLATREQGNALSSWVDASHAYGNHIDDTNTLLRTPSLCKTTLFLRKSIKVRKVFSK